MINQLLRHSRAPAADDAGTGSARCSSWVAHLFGSACALVSERSPIAVRRAWYELGFGAIGFLLLVWVLTLGRAGIRESLAARHEASPPGHALNGAQAVRANPVGPVTRTVKFRLHRARTVAPYTPFPRSNDPADDAASDDPNDDDDNWESLNARDDNTRPYIACLPKVVRYLVTPVIQPRPVSTRPASLPFPTAEQLRC
jgi:hypothetical protein